MGVRGKPGLFLVLGLSIAVATGGTFERAVEAAPRYEITHKRKLAEGLRVTWIRDNRGPNRIKVLTLDPTSPLTLDVELSNNRLPGRETTSSMSRRRGAIAATNGTFGLPYGRPVGLFLEDSYLKASPLLWGNGFALTENEQSAFVGHPDVRVTMTGTADGKESVIWAWNEPGIPPAPLLGYTKAGGRRERPPENACSARLIEESAGMWTEGNNGVGREYRVAKVRCADKRMRRYGGVVVSAPYGSKHLDRIKRLEEGQLLHLSWSVGWPGVLDAIAGNPVLVEDGRNVAYDCASYFCKANPRTGIGVKGSGRVLIVTVDGRQAQSVGMSLLQFARLFRHLGATDALNLDGGGSTTMVVNDSVINKPSDPAGERDVSSSLLVLPGTDPGEPTIFPHVPAGNGETLNTLEGNGEGFESIVAEGSRNDPAVRDPGSTGGMLDALMKRNRDSSQVNLPRSLLKIAEEYRSTSRR